ncbi:MAG: hypothetical protein ACOYK9_00540 [Chlamydiia bacterium]
MNLVEELLVYEKGSPKLLKNYYLHDLLPYDIRKKTKAELRSSLKEYFALLSIVIEAVTFFQAGNYEKFDALVGENACQIRAVFVATTAFRNLIACDALLIETKRIKGKTEVLLEEKIIAALMTEEVSFAQVIKDNDLIFSLGFEGVFLVLSFILTETMSIIYDYNDDSSLSLKGKSVHQKLNRFGEITSNFSLKLFARSRKLLAELSTQYIQEIAHKLNDEKLDLMLSEKFIVKYNGHLLVAPMFWTYKCLLLAAEKEGIPIIIHAKFLKKKDSCFTVVDNEWLFFETSLSKGIELNQQKNNLSKAVWVIEGAVRVDRDDSDFKNEWKRKITKYSANTIILAGAADHRQYPDPKQDQKIEIIEDCEYECYKEFARLEGFSASNPTMFFIQHVYAASIERCLRFSILN